MLELYLIVVSPSNLSIKFKQIFEKQELIEYVRYDRYNPTPPSHYCVFIFSFVVS